MKQLDMKRGVLSAEQQQLLRTDIHSIQATSLLKHQMLSGLKQYQLDRLVTKYIDGVAKQVMSNYELGLRSHHMLKFSLAELRNSCGRIKIEDKLIWISELMAETAPLFQVSAKGNGISKDLTSVMLSHRDVWEKVLKTDTWDQQVAAENQCAQRPTNEVLNDDSMVVETPIHVRNLEKCIKRSENHKAYLEQLVNVHGDESAVKSRGGETRRLYYQCQSAILNRQQITRAKLLIELAKLCDKKWPYRDGFYLVPLAYKAHGKTPRLWAQGNINLQFAQREIRYAALSRGHQYDLSTASFSLMLAYAEAIGGVEIEAEYVKAYIENKSEFRQRAVAEIFGEHLAFKGSYAMRQVKQALTAIGFGAKTTGCFQEAMREAFNNNRKHADGFVNHEVIAGLAADWKKICDIIVNHHGKQLKAYGFIELYEGFRYTNDGRLDRSKLLAYIYQSLERMALDKAMKLIEIRGKTLLVPLHDGFITAEKLDLTELNDMIRGVFWSKSYIKFEHEKIKSRIIVDPLGSEIEKDAHTARLAAEERQARQPFGLQ